MKVVILGCGRVGSLLARELAQAGHQVTVIDLSADALRRVSDLSLDKVVGSGIDEAVLRRAGIETADAFVAVTNGDNTNIMSVQIAKLEFNVQHSVARIYDPIRARAYRGMGINTICTSLLGTGLLRDYVVGKPWGSVTDYIAPLIQPEPASKEN